MLPTVVMLSTSVLPSHLASLYLHLLSLLSGFTTAAVVLAFFLCWAPFHAQRLSYVYFKKSLVFRTINEYLYYVSGFLYYLSATVNPILYNLMSLKYRWVVSLWVFFCLTRSIG